MHVSVAPRVRLQPATAPTTLRGLVRPIVPGARVDVQRLVGSSWRPAATATLADNGSFEAPVLRVVTG